MDNPMISPVEASGQDECVDYKPWIGMKFISEIEAFDFYNRYGGIVGFTGHRKKDKRDVNTTKPRAETRTDCPARMGISILKNGGYECKDFCDDHNHELRTPDSTHFMRSQRKISKVDAYEIDMADDTGIRPKATFDLMGMQAGGRENLGYTKEDLRNHLRTKRQRDLSYGEAGSLLVYFEKQTRLNPSFTYFLQMDNEEQITNIFWADPRMIIDYSLFGDVVIFDTTFFTNKMYRPFGVFARFNHHRGVTIFGAALLYDETAESFKWLFQTFLEAHGQKNPITIFTDQDAAMAKAIVEILPKAWHGLCTWHIMQNGIKHHGNLMKHGSPFLKDLNKCIFHYEDVEEFQNAWKKLRDDYQLENISWLYRIYKIKEKWARCYMKYTFTLGVRSTQLSESINSDLKEYLRPGLDLIRFFKHFEQVVEDKRANELKVEFDAKNNIPKNINSKSPVLRQAGKVYTPYIFERFLEEHDWMSACVIKSHKGDDVFCEYVVGLVDEEMKLMEGEYVVLYNASEQLIECSCRKFETFGILCCHALKILDVLNFKCIPEKYILRRWTRAVKSFVVDDSNGKQVEEDVQRSCTQRFKFLCPKYIQLVNQASNTEAGFEIAKMNVDLLSKQLVALDVDSPNIEASSFECFDVNTDLGLKKKECTKGNSSKRHKGWSENMGKQKTKNGEKAYKSHSSVEIENTQDMENTQDIERFQDLENLQTFISSGFPSQDLVSCDVRDASQPINTPQTFTSLLLGGGSSQGSTPPPILHPSQYQGPGEYVKNLIRNVHSFFSFAVGDDFLKNDIRIKYKNIRERWDWILELCNCEQQS
ncbi:protein FAR1-RELATED SEQUENCE 5-like [Telopea speciosissima]|uniref:protein FAR1-RELATED SEQUENCE 5-like n=1 Tax=Telopea speciosissima TaxID=54955 RepID=UPI001CC33509|nr:protein FAR1-RELATED SEQUENCE 5-like [Telopea speciosissima]